jgi:hypothetical protein
LKTRTCALTIAGVAASFACIAPLPAQGSTPVEPVDSIVARFERETRAHDPATRAVHVIGTEFATGPYSARKDSLLDRLERLANFSTDENVRAFSTQMVASAGELGRASPPLPDIVQRLERIYRRRSGGDDHRARLLIVSSLPLQSERRAAAVLLRAIASEPDPANHGTGPHGYFSVGDLRTEALASLARMGEDGRTVLQAMRRDSGAMSPQTRIALERMAQRGFPVTDAVERRRAATRRMLQQP